MRSVRPVGSPPSLELILPTIPWREEPVDSGGTTGTKGSTTPGTTERLRYLAAEAERAGAGGLWVCDHLFWHRPLLEPMAALAVAATATSSATLGTCVLQLPMRSPAAVARQAATLQLLSEGRFVLGLGVGSHPLEYQAAGAEYSGRGRRLDDGIELLRRAWSSARTGERYRLEPATPPIPLWIGGASDAAIARAAAAGDGWVPLFVEPDRYGSLLRRLGDLATEAGREPAEIEAAVVVMVHVGASEGLARAAGTRWLSHLYDLPPKAFERQLIAGTAEDCAAAIDRYREEGAAHVVVMVAADETLEQFGTLTEACTAAEPSDPHRRLRADPSPQLQRLGAAR